MKQILKKCSMVAVAAVMAAWIPFAGTQSVEALSSCPTDPLTGFTPHNTNYNDSDAVNVGVKFEVRGAPFVSGVKFYKGTDNTGTHVAHLYNVTTSTELASEEFTGETSTGWQTVSFDSNIQVRDDHSYMVWVSMPNGHYAADGTFAGGSNYFGPFGHGQYGNAEDVVIIPAGNSGMYSYTSDHTTVPSNATSNNYWVSPVVSDTTAPQVNSGYSSSNSNAGRTLSWSTTGKDTNSATSNGATQRTQVTRQQGEIVDVLGYQPGGQSSFTDATAHLGTTYSYSVTNVDACGNGGGNSTSSGGSWSATFDTIFGSSTPSTLDSGQTTPVTLGMRWSSAVDGQLVGVRIYRQAGSYPTGSAPLTVGLWDTSGNLLASRSLLPGNQQSGWINVRFNSPVSINDSTDYIAGYFAPNGQEMYTANAFDTATTNGDLTAKADTTNEPNGVYSTNSTMAFPSSAAPNNSWYGVDVMFEEL